MRYTRLGTSGLRVSRIALGCMSYGQPGSGFHSWTLDEQASAPFFRAAVESGITFWDTANVYSDGSSERLIGRAIRKYSRREDIVLATKLLGKMHGGPGGSGTSRKAIFEQVDASLTRLDTDYIDVYQIHGHDPEVTDEETMEALHDVVKSGKVRYLGACNLPAWRLATMQHVADVNGWTEFVSVQNQYNLVYREEEREMFPYLGAAGVGAVPWSPLARGRVTRPWGEQTSRSEDDELGRRLTSSKDHAVVDAVESVASERGVGMAQVALAWVLRNPLVTSPIIGATKPSHLIDAVGAVEIALSDDEAARLEQSYTPRAPIAIG